MKKEGIKCVCGKVAKPEKNLSFNRFKIDGWKCKCGEIYYNPEQTERILILNKLKKAKIKVKLGQNKNNLILRIPKAIENAIGLKKGKEIELELNNDDNIVINTH